MNNLFVPVLLGTAREGRQSEKAAKYTFKQVKKFGFNSELVDVRDHLSEARTKRVEESDWKNLMSKADGLIIVSPEYNHGYPGELKILLDSCYDQYHKKPVAVCGVSMGGLGGARMVEALRISLIELQMVPCRNAVYFSEIHKMFSDDGSIKDGSFAERFEPMFEELKWYAQALKKARN